LHENKFYYGNKYGKRSVSRLRTNYGDRLVPLLEIGNLVLRLWLYLSSAKRLTILQILLVLGIIVCSTWNQADFRLSKINRKRCKKTLKKPRNFSSSLTAAMAFW